MDTHSYLHGKVIRRSAPVHNTPNSVDVLTRASTEDLLAALGLEKCIWGRRLLAPLCWLATRRFAQQMATFDRLVGQVGLDEAARWLLGQTVRRVETAGLEHLAGQGPLLVVSNHPGLTDTLALFASLPRPDLRILAASRPFLRALQCTSRQLFYLSEGGGEGLGVLRCAVAHLRSGGAILTFPGGRIEPDPAVLSGALESLETWSPSLGVLARLAPEASVVPAIVSGVLSPAAQRSPVTRLRRSRSDRARLGAMLQVALPIYQGVTVRVAFGPPLRVAEQLQAGADARDITSAVIDAARRLITSSPARWQPLVPPPRASAQPRG
jgi:hypothetical protein